MKSCNLLSFEHWNALAVHPLTHQWAFSMFNRNCGPFEESRTSATLPATERIAIKTMQGSGSLLEPHQAGKLDHQDQS